LSPRRWEKFAAFRRRAAQRRDHRHRPDQRVLFYEKREEFRREALASDWRCCIPDPRQGRDGLLDVLVDDHDGAILRIEPAG